MSTLQQQQPRRLCRNCGRAIRRVFCHATFGQHAAARYRRQQMFKEFPDSIEEVKRLTGIATVLSLTWVTDVERWIKHAVLWDGTSYGDEYFCGQGCTMRFGRHQAALGAATGQHADGLLRENARPRKSERVKHIMLVKQGTQSSR